MHDIDERRQGSAAPRGGAIRGALLALVCALMVAACGGDDDPAPTPDPAPAPVEASSTIGPAGGTLNGPDGVQVVVPAGALVQDTVIRVARTAAGAPTPIPDGVPTAATIYEFTPHDIDFAVPVTISAPAPATTGAQVFMASRDADWRAVGSADSGTRLQWEVLGFSWAVVADSCAPRNNDPYPCTWPRTTAELSAVPPAALTRLSVGSSVPVYRVAQAATVDLRFTFSAARDCGSASVKITRWKQGVNNASGRPVVTTLLDTSFPTLQPDPQNSSRAGGEVSVPLAFTEADNGVHYVASSFSCLRSGQSQRSTFGGTVRINAEIQPSPVAAPTITQQPADQTVAAGATATFSAATSGTPTPTLQWQRSTDGGVTWVDIAGATSGSYTTPATVAGDSGQRFRAVATNSAGSASSSPAQLIVNAVAAVPAPDALDATAGHTCALKADQTVACWGLGSDYQLGNGGLLNRLVPTPVSGLTGAVAVTVGAFQSCARLANGSVACWGGNARGEVGTGDTQPAPVPVVLPALSGALAISAGRNHTCALLADRTVACWGGNADGQLGNGTTTDSPSPVTVPGLSNVQSVVAGWDRSCAVLGGGSVRCWGWNETGQLGDGTLVSRSVPTEVVGLGGVAAVAIDGNYHSCALKSDGSVVCWGDNRRGSLGTGGPLDIQPLPVAVSGLGSVVALATGSGSSCAVQAGGSLSCWGENSRGSVGDGSTTDRPTPVAVPGISGAVAVKVGSAYTCTLKGDGSMSCWGRNITGSLGDGTTVDRTSPVSVVGGAIFWH